MFKRTRTSAAGAAPITGNPSVQQQEQVINGRRRDTKPVIVKLDNIGVMMTRRTPHASVLAYDANRLNRSTLLMSGRGGIPPTIRIFASFSATDARDPTTWIQVITAITHPSMPHCPPPPQCDPTDEVLVAPLEPGIADVGLIFLEHAPATVVPAALAAPGTLERSEGARTVIVGYGTTTPRRSSVLPVDASAWDGKRRVRFSALRRVVDETWGLWSIPSYVCSGDSGGGIFLTGRLVGNVATS